MARVQDTRPQEDRLEEPRIGGGHHPRGGHRGEIGGPLMPPLRPERLPERSDNERADQQRSNEAEQQNGRLARLASEPMK
jgi:hypothetical protein